MVSVTQQNNAIVKTSSLPHLAQVHTASTLLIPRIRQREHGLNSAADG